VADYEELNTLLAERCLAHGNGIISGREDRRTIDERHEEERCQLLSLPPKPFENIKPVQVQVSRYQTVMVDRNRYSVPGAHVGRKVWAHIDCDRVRIHADGKEIADHPRLFGNSKWQIDPQHYLELIAERIQAFESARAIRQWRPSWPGTYETMLSILQDRLGNNKGTRDFVRILQLHKDYPSEEVNRAVEQALEYSSYSHDAVKHLLLSRTTPMQSYVPLNPDLIPGITDRWIADSDLNCYDALLAGGAL